MAIALGINGWLGFGEETTFGTPSVGTYRYLEPLDESIALKHQYISKPALRQATQKNRVISKKTVEGGCKFQFPWEGSEYLLKHALGAVSAVSGAGPWTRTFTLATALPTGLTVQVNRDAAAIGGSSMSVYEGCQISKLTISQGKEDFAMMAVDLIGEDLSLAAIATPTFTSFVGVDWTQITTASLNAGNIAIEDFELTIDNGLAADRFKLGSRLRKGLGRSAARVISGKFTIEYEQLTELNSYLNLTNGMAMSIVWTGTSGRVMTLTLPAVVLDGAESALADPGPLKVPLAFTAYQSAAANDELNIILINQLSTAI
jgi:hypothetical protein